ncbi:MAG: hypothetical protein ACRCS9_01295 [Hyphomicrobium sp.]
MSYALLFAALPSTSGLISGARESLLTYAQDHSMLSPVFFRTLTIQGH